MLTALDETFMHQTPLTFDQAATSDHRFFDRMWLGGHSKDGLHFIMGMAAYKNTNTFDGYFTVIKDGKQYNLRVSRPLLPHPAEMRVGPISVDILTPLEQLRIVVTPGPDHPLAADLTFTGTVPTSLEAPHQGRVDGRTTNDYLRFDQIGRIDGWIEIAGERVTAERWYGGRDHSWGVRAGQGGYEPLTRLARPGENPNDVGAGHDGFLVVVLWFDCPSVAGYLMQIENGAGETVYSHGRIVKREDGRHREVETTSIDHKLAFIPGTRTSTGGTITAVTTEGETYEIEVTGQIPPFCYRGTGYDGGFDDGRGLGFHRGTVLESDVYDVSHPEDVVLPDGRTIRPWHREGGALVRINGEDGQAHFPVASSGPIRKYGLGV